MKKLIFIFGLSLMTTGAFANGINNQVDPVTKCCTRSANNGKEGADYISVTVTRCTTSASGNSHAATAHACSAAESNAKNAVAAIENFSVTLINNN